MKNFLIINRSLGWILFCLALTVYRLTIEPTASFWDCSEYIAAAYKLEVTHPPGAPLFLLLGRLFSFLAGNNIQQVAFWINMSAAVSSAAVVMFCFWINSLMARKALRKQATQLTQQEAYMVWLSACIGSLALLFSSTFWNNATEAETYALSTLLMCLALWSVLNWELAAKHKLSSMKWLYLGVYIIGLSLGVRMFAVLAIPSLLLLFYCSNKKVITLRQIVATLLAGFLLLGFIYAGITLGLPTLALQVEIFFVNQLQLPFLSGIITFFLAIGAILVYGIFYAHKKDKKYLQVFFIMISLLLIGYSSYALVPIRSQANPPINEGQPSNILNFITYLKREQYGQRPLLYGPHFAGKIINEKKGEAIYKINNHKYEIVGYKQALVYAPGSYVLFPRTWSNQNPAHIMAYRNLLALKPGQAPGILDQWYFLIKHQLGFSYLRYFCWNFAGRASDQQGAGWLSPLDAFKKLPPTLANTPGRSNYLFLPLILGLIGIFFQYKHDRLTFTAMGWLFLMLGIALIIFLNPPPIEPRERDYIYVGSFVVFTFWIGLGALALMFYIRQFKRFSTYNVCLTSMFCFSVPIIMAQQGWHAHARAGRYFSVESAKNLLNSCAQNAILFTAGDNDTFPLWYVQEVEGFRTDVRVIVISYANAAWYIAQLAKTVNNSPALQLSVPQSAYEQYGLNDFLPYIAHDGVEGPLDLEQYFKLIQSSHPALQIATQLVAAKNTLPSKELTYTLPDQGILVNQGIVPSFLSHLIPKKLTFFVHGPGLEKKDLLLLDIIQTSQWKRPIYFNHSSLRGFNLDLSKHLVNEGMALRLLPIENTTGVELVDTDKMYDHLMHHFHWRGLDNKTVYYDENYRRLFIQNHRMAFFTLAKSLAEKGKKELAQQVLCYALAKMPPKPVPYDLANVHMIALLFKLGANEKALEIIADVGPRAIQIVNYYLQHQDLSQGILKENLAIIYEIEQNLEKFGYQEAATVYQEVLTNFEEYMNNSALAED